MFLYNLIYVHFSVMTHLTRKLLLELGDILLKLYLLIDNSVSVGTLSLKYILVTHTNSLPGTTKFFWSPTQIFGSNKNKVCFNVKVCDLGSCHLALKHSVKCMTALYSM